MENNHDYTVDESDQANIQTKEFGNEFAYDSEKDHAHIHKQEIRKSLLTLMKRITHIFIHGKMRGINSLSVQR